MKIRLALYLYTVFALFIISMMGASIASITSTPKALCDGKECQSENKFVEKKEIFFCGNLAEGDTAMESKMLKPEKNMNERDSFRWNKKDIFTVEGYMRSSYVFGEMVFVDKTQVEGFIYSNNKKTYVFGVKRNEEKINAYDYMGNYFSLTLLSEGSIVSCYPDD